MTTQTKEKLTTISAAFPVLLLVLVYLFIIRTRLHFGHWPSAADGMAKYMGFTLLQSLAVYTLLASPLIVIAVLVAAFVFRREDSGFRLARPLVVFVASVLLCTALSVADPGGFILWFVD